MDDDVRDGSEIRMWFNIGHIDEQPHGSHKVTHSELRLPPNS